MKGQRTGINLKENSMNSAKFREELKKIMPGYRWTIHRNMFSKAKYLSATGIQTSGFNRLSTLQVIKRVKELYCEYEVKSAGFGTNAPWLSEYTDTTLARSLRGLQDHYSRMADNYFRHAADLQHGRKHNNPIQPTKGG